MSRQIISQVLSPTNATYINGVSAERRFSPAVFKNLYQGLVEKNNLGVNDKFVSSDDAQSAAQVFVNRVVPIRMKPRELGANKNGASFSNVGHYSQTETVGIEILQVLDDTITIPRATQDHITIDLLAEHTEIYSNRIKTILNGATAASKLFAVWSAEDRGEEVNKLTISTADINGGLVLQRFIEGNSLLDEGDVAHGVDIFPEDTRIAVFKVSYRAILKAKGILTIGGANYGYDIAKSGAVSTVDQTRKSEDGFIGYIDDVPCHLISNESLQHCSEYLGFPENELRENAFKGYIASSFANARGVTTTKTTKIVDALAGQGIVLQPYTKFGVISWYPKGNVIISEEDGYSPIKDLKALFTGANITFKIKSAGSRLFPKITFTAKANAGFTATVNAYDDFGTDALNDHVVGIHYVVTDAKVTTVGGFLKAVKVAGAEHKVVTSGTPVVLDDALTAGKYVTVLAIADDGSVSLADYGYTA